MSGIPFSQPFIANNEERYLLECLNRSSTPTATDFGAYCKKQLVDLLNTNFVHLTNSGTAALEIASILCEIKSGDEVIMPSFTFTSTANAVVLRGGVPVFVDVTSGTLNIDQDKIKKAITPKTKAIVAVHYAGNACNMNALVALAVSNNLWLIEDAAQALGSTYNGVPLGTIGDFGAISFHKTKNVHCGEGGAFIAKNSADHKKAGQVIEKGTNRTDFLEGNVSKYNWITVGSSFVLSDMQNSVLAAQLEDWSLITAKRIDIWNRYHAELADLEDSGLILRPQKEPLSKINGHIYFIRLKSKSARDLVRQRLMDMGINTYTHFEPLHLSPAGRRYGRTSGDLLVTEEASQCLLRLPIWPHMPLKKVDLVVDGIKKSVPR